MLFLTLYPEKAPTSGINWFNAARELYNYNMYSRFICLLFFENFKSLQSYPESSNFYLSEVYVVSNIHCAYKKHQDNFCRSVGSERFVGFRSKIVCVLN